MSGTQATAGNWMTQTINGMQYDVLLPANYDPSVKYPTVLYLHQLDMGNDPVDLVNEVNSWFNSAAFRTDHPAIVIMPLLDQSADPSGQTINWGGVSTADSAGESNALAALKQVMGQYSADTSRVYVTGNSMGGIGTEDMLIKYNAYTGTEGKIFAAGLALAGADYGQGYPQPNQSVVTALKNVPFWAIHGGQDTTVPLAFDQNLYAAEQAIGGDMIYTQDNGLGHDVWDTYYPQTGTNSPLGWLFRQSASGTVTPPPSNGTASANNTVVMAGSTSAIVDAAGNKWTITPGGQVAVNGTPDATTGNVVELAYVDGKVWQENTAKLWWAKTSPTDGWSPAAGTATSPLPIKASVNDTVIMAGSPSAIVDAGGNKWTITSGGQVAVNGTADASTANVIELAYVDGKVWQENAAKLWWAKTSPTDGWSPAAGTATSPLPVKASADRTVLLTGSSGAVTDTKGNLWTITPGGQVAVNGTADVTTANVTELTYVGGKVWQENAAKLWWGKSSPSDGWSLATGAATSPLTGAGTITQTQTATTVSLSQIVLTLPASGKMLFVSGTGDTITVSGTVSDGAQSITDTGGKNTYVLHAAGHGAETFTSNILKLGDTLDLHAALAATDWKGTASTLSSYLSLSSRGQSAVLSVATHAGGTGTMIATINGAGGTTLSGLLAHASI